MTKYSLILNILLIIFLVGSIKTCQRNKEAKRIGESNLESAYSEMSTYRDKNDSLVYIISGIEVNYRSLDNINKELHNEISALKTKLKNAQSITKVVTKTEYINRDIIIGIPTTDTTTLFTISEPFLDLKLTLSSNNTIQKENVHISLCDTLYTTHVIKTKGWFLWKRVDGVELHIKNKNPYVKVMDGMYIDMNIRRNGKRR